LGFGTLRINFVRPKRFDVTAPPKVDTQMLDAGRPPEFIGGLSVFFDHADAQRRYVLAEVPRLVANPDPQVSLLLFRGEERSGGLLQFESILAPTEDQLAAVEEELAGRGRIPTLARPDWRSGTVSLAGWLAADELAPLQLATGPPMLVGDPMAVIAARLDADGAALADGALRGNALPTVVIYELEALGLAGPLGIEAEADLRAIHDRLTAEGALTTPYGRARIAKTWEDLARDNLIRIRVVDESGDVESRRAEAMRQVGQDLVAKMFSPAPPPETPPQLDDQTVASIELSFRLTMRREELETTSRWSFMERRAVPIRHYAAASLVDLLGNSPAENHIGFADLVEENAELTARVEPELGALGISAVEIDVRRGTEGDAEHTFTLTDEAAESSRPMRLPPGEPLEYRVRARFDPEQTRAEDRETDWMEVYGRLIVASARRFFPPRELTVIAGRVEFDWLDHVEVIVEAPTEPPRSFSLNGDNRSVSAYFPAAGDGVFSLTSHWRGLPGEPTLSDETREIDDDIFVLDGPFGDSLELFVVPLPLADVVAIAVDVRTEHDGFIHSKSLSWDEPDIAPRRAGLRRLAGSRRSYSFRSTLIHSDGTLDETTWTETDKLTLVIPPGDPVEVHSVEVVVLGGGPAGRGSLAIELSLAAGEHRVRQVLEGDRDQVDLVLVVPESSPEPVLTSREFLSSGAVHETRWETPGALIVLPPAAPGDI